jgi:hypothetical protein
MNNRGIVQIKKAKEITIVVIDDSDDEVMIHNGSGWEVSSSEKNPLFDVVAWAQEDVSAGEKPMEIDQSMESVVRSGKASKRKESSEDGEWIPTSRNSLRHNSALIHYILQQNITSKSRRQRLERGGRNRKTL